MKNIFGFLLFATVLTTSVFAQNGSEDTAQIKQQSFSHYLGPSIGIGAMKMKTGAVLTADVGVSYDFYMFDWFSISGGITAHQEFYFNQPSDDKRTVPLGNPFCITVPIGVHFNIPKAEWLYTGLSVALNFPLFDLSSPQNGYSTENEFFISLPIDFGIDILKSGGGRSRLFLRVTPTFHRDEVIVPVGLVWQIHSWKIGSNTKAANVQQPSTPTIIIIN